MALSVGAGGTSTVDPAVNWMLDLGLAGLVNRLQSPARPISFSMDEPHVGLPTAPWSYPTVPKVRNILSESALPTAVRGVNAPGCWIEVGRMSWAELLGAENREEMRVELTATLQAALATDNWDSYMDALRSWEATASVHSDPELLAELLARGDPSEEVMLRRP